MKKNKEYNPLIKFFKYMGLAKKDYAIGSVLMILSTFLLTVTTYIISMIFDDSYEKALLYIKIFLIITLISAIIEYFKRYYLVKASNKLYIGIQTMIYDHIQDLPIKYFDNMPAGAVVSRLISDVLFLKNFFENTLIFVVTVLLKLFFIYAVLFYVNYKMALVLVAFLIFMLGIKSIYEKLVFPHTTDYRKYNSKCTALINEGLQNLDIIKAFNNEENIKDEWKEASKNRTRVGKNIVRVDAKLLHNLTALARDLIFTLALIYYAYSHLTGENIVSVGIMYLFVRYTLDVIEAVTNLVVNLSVYSKAIGAARNIDEILKLDKDIQEIVRPEDRIKEFKGNIEFKDVYFSYDDNNYILNNISFKIDEDQTVAFVGRTGSGKSTIISLLDKFYTNQKGEILVSGKNIKNIKKKYIREKIAIVLQEPFLFEGTLLENICLGSGDRELATNCLKELGAEFLIQNGRSLDTKITINGNNFSEGEKQLISFARALAKNPKILILDEATANIDSETEKYIQNSIEKLKKNRTTIMIAHRLSTIKNADKIFVLSKGNILESGTHDELMKMNSEYAKMYNNQK